MPKVTRKSHWSRLLCRAAASRVRRRQTVSKRPGMTGAASQAGEIQHCKDGKGRRVPRLALRPPRGAGAAFHFLQHAIVPVILAPQLLVRRAPEIVDLAF